MKYIITILILFSANFAQARQRGLLNPLTDDTLAIWLFSEATGNTANDLTGTFNGTIYSALWIDAPMGGGLDFNGNSAWYVTTGLVASTHIGDANPLTISFWVYPTNPTYEQYFFGRFQSGRRFYFGLMSNALPRLGLGMVVLNADAGNEVDTNKWNKIDFVYTGGSGEGSKVFIYLNGERVLDYDHTFAGDLTTGESHIGKLGDRTTMAFSGEVANGLVFNKAISEAEAKYYYNLQAPAFGREQIK